MYKADNKENWTLDWRKQQKRIKVEINWKHEQQSENKVVDEKDWSRLHCTLNFLYIYIHFLLARRAHNWMLQWRDISRIEFIAVIITQFLMSTIDIKSDDLD
jgi:hypothetical protein